MSTELTAHAAPVAEVPDSGSAERIQEQAARAAVLLGNDFPDSRLALLRSAELIAVLEELVGVQGFLPEEVRRAVQVGGSPDPRDPVGSLIERCRQLPAMVVTPQPQAGEPPLVHAEATPSPIVPTHPVETAFTTPAPAGFRPVSTHRAPRPRATLGWRRVLHLAPGRAELAEQALIEAVRRPFAGCRSIIVLALKGGTGKTTTSVMLGHTFATHRDDRVVALDASADTGTLAFRIADDPRASVRGLVAQAAQMQRYADVRELSGHATSRLDVIASDADPHASRPFLGADYREATRILSRFYNVAITDCGAGLVHDVMSSVLAGADQLVLVTSPSLDGLRSAGLTIDWLAAHGYDALLRHGVVVLNDTGRSTGADLDQARDYFSGRCRAVADIPSDPHLAEGGPTDLGQVAERTRLAYLKLAALIAEGFDTPAGGTR